MIKNKQQINSEHPRIKNRTPEQQHYRDNLAKTLKQERSLGPIGKLLANNTLRETQSTTEYILAEWLYTLKAAEKLIDLGYGWVVVKNLKKFEGLNHQKIAEKLIDAGYIKTVAYNLGNFKGLNQEIAEKLIDAGDADEVKKNIASFKQE